MTWLASYTLTTGNTAGDNNLVTNSFCLGGWRGNYSPRLIRSNELPDCQSCAAWLSPSSHPTLSANDYTSLQGKQKEDHTSSSVLQLTACTEHKSRTILHLSCSSLPARNTTAGSYLTICPATHSPQGKQKQDHTLPSVLLLTACT